MIRRKFIKGILSIIGLGLTTGLYSWTIEPFWLEFVKRKMPIANLPDNLIGKKLMQISDIHVGNRFDYNYIIDSFKKAQKFNPDFVGVSAGFVAYEKDRLLSLKFTQKGYYECGLRLRRAFPNIFGVLEGGYHNEILECVEAFVEGVNVGARPRKDMYDINMSLG